MRRARGQLANVRLWASLALGFSVLRLAVEGPAGSALWFIEPLLVAGFLVGSRKDRPWRRRLRPRRAAAAFVTLSWVTGMLYELTLSDQGAAFGGLAKTTAASFALAQGWYPVFAVLGLLMIRRYGLSFGQVFLAAGAACAFEVVINGLLLAVVASPLVVLAPLVAGYYVTVYGMLLAWPLLFLDERALHGRRPRPLSARTVGLLGVGASGISWLCFGGLAALLDALAPGFVPR